MKKSNNIPNQIVSFLLFIIILTIIPTTSSSTTSQQQPQTSEQEVDGWWPWHNRTRPPPTPAPPSNACHTHTNCVQCNLASSFCHWCAHDEQCHPIGSIHGCAYGVNCHSQDRCARNVPERMDATKGEVRVLGRWVWIVIVGGAVGLGVGCTVCLVLWMVLRDGYLGLLERCDVMNGQYEESRGRRRVEEIVDEENDDGGEKVSFSRKKKNKRQGNPFVEMSSSLDVRSSEKTEEHKEDVENEELAEPLLQNEDLMNPEDPQVDEFHDEIQGYPTPSPTPNNNSNNNSTPPKLIQCLSITFQTCYIITILLLILTSYTLLHLYPKYPQYNVCSDAVAWKSIMTGMTSLKVKANFDILVSVQNPNHFAIDLDAGSGTFSHDGMVVGRFEVPYVRIEEMSVTDILFTTTFTPDKGEALSLLAEYYEGTLIFDLDGKVVTRVPKLFNYSFASKFDNYPVHVNDPTMMDRHLCACPTWEDEKKNNHPSGPPL